jgi:hypothetical protein
MKTKIALALTALSLSCCTAVVAPDGTKTTRPDKASVNSALGFGRYVFDRLAPAPVNVKATK